MENSLLIKRLGPVFSIALILGISLDVSASLVNGDFETGDLTGWSQLQSDSALQQEVVSAPTEFNPPLSGFSYKIRPGSQAADAGLSQSVTTSTGQSYNWSVDIAAREVQSFRFPLGTFELLLDGTVVASQTLAGASPFSTTFSGVYTALDSAVEFRLVFNRPILSYTAHPQWFADNASFDEVSSVPVPAAVWLFGTALIGLFGFDKRRKAA